MNPTSPFVYIADCPLQEQPIFGWSFYCRPIHIFVPPGPLPFSRIREFEKHAFLKVHRAEGASEKEVQRLINDWERWAQDHEDMDWNALKAFDHFHSIESQNLPNLMKEIKRFGSEAKSVSGNRIQNQTLLLHLARRLWNTDRECRDILHEVRSKENALRDIIDASETEELFSESLYLDGAIDFDGVLKRQLKAWGYFYGPVRWAAAHYVTDNEFLTRYLSARLESVRVVRFKLPLFEDYGPEQLAGTLQDIGKRLLDELHSCFDELARLASFTELNHGDLDLLGNRFAEASESINSTAGEDRFPLNTGKDLSVDLMLVHNQGFEQMLFEDLDAEKGSQSGIETAGWTSILSVES